VVEGIIKSHHGAIDAKSEVGRGSLFQLYFPVTVTLAMEETPTRGAPGKNAHVFYVDDDEELSILVSRALRRMGYRVTAHSNSKKALEDFRTRPDAFDLVVTDISMPGLSGPDLVQEVRMLRPNIFTIMFSGYVRPEDHEAAERLKVNKLLYKPGSIAELSQALSEEFTTHSGRKP
jgi:CheY-like chemotaxis protein